MAVFETLLKSDLNRAVQVKQLTGNLFSGDNGGNKITAEVTDNGVPVDLSGTVTGYIIRDDNSTITASGVLTDAEGSTSGTPKCRASITLPADAYNVIGRVSIVIKVGSVTVGACTSYVYRTNTEVAIDSGSVIPSLSELVTAAETALTNAGLAETAATAANTAAAAAENVNIAQSKSGKVITITTTNRNNQQTSKTVTEPTLTVSKSNGTVTLTATDVDGTSSVTFTETEIDDTKGIGYDGVALSADRIAKEYVSQEGRKANADSISVYKERSGDIVTVEDAVSEAVKRMQIAIAPVQDLHGYDKPWVGGAGKNLLNLSSISTVTSNNVTITPTKNAEGALTSVVVSTNGSASSVTVFSYNKNLTFDFDTILSGGSSTATVDVNNGSYLDNGSGITIPANTTISNFRIRVASGVSANVTLYPMIRKATDTNASFAPYSNICPISGWTGAEVTRTGNNLFDKSTAIQRTVNASGEISYNSLALLTDYIPVLNGQIVFSAMRIGSTSDNTLRLILYDENKTFIGRSMSTAVGAGVKAVASVNDDSVKFVRANIYTNTEDIDTAQVENGLIATEYEPYTGKTYSITFPSEVGTVYGGTLTVEQDGSGTLVVDRAKTTINENTSLSNDTSGFYAQNNNVLRSMDYTNGDVIICDKLPTVDSHQTLKTLNVGITGYVHATQLSGQNWIYFKNGDSLITTVSQMQTWLASNPLDVCFKLASPTTIPFTASEVLTLLNGYNTIYADCGDITVLYPAEKYLTAEQADRERIHETVATPADVMTISDGADNVAVSELKVAIEPVQDLHGYGNPWVGGAGKNLLKTTLDWLKSQNTAGTWSGNVYTFRGETFTVKEDADGNITGIVANGTPSTSPAFIAIPFTLENGVSYAVNGCPSGGSTSTYCINVIKDDSTVANDVGSGTTFTYDSTATTYYARIAVRVNVTNLEFKPMIRLSTVTDGTFAPYENICPISGFTGAEVTRTGKNLFDKTQNTLVAGNGYKYYLDSSGNHDLKCSSSSTATTVAVPCEPNRTYTAQITSAGNIFRFCYCKDMDFATKIAGGNTITTYGFQSISATGNKSLTLTTGDWARYLIVQSDSITFSTDKETLMILNGDSAQEYEQFMGYDVYSITFPTSSGTVYGGELTVNGDGGGSLVVNRANLVFDGSADENIQLISGTNNFFAVIIGSALYRNFNEDDSFKCNMFEKIAITNSNTLMGVCVVNNQDVRFRYALNNTLTVSDARAFLASNPMQIAVGLLTPVTYSIPAPIVRTLLGINNLWSNTGKINSLSYSADIKTYIDNYGQTEEDFTANTNIASGEYFQIGNTLYIATSAIASGETIVPGTNCTKTTIAEVLNADATGMSF